MQDLFTLIEEVSTQNFKASLLRHDKLGLEIVFLKNEDPNRTFAISFYTPPSDSKGTPHILEHSVLCGSKKFPLKDPFAVLLKSSLHTYLNAFTAHSYTVYPAASQNLKDFENLFTVYWDAVFHPLLTEETFARQAWHYRVNGQITRQGVVYNEMKGRYADVDSLLYRATLKALFPGTQYEFDSGGDPGEIPKLSYKELLEFHSEHYHPSNSKLLFYGDLDQQKVLDMVSENLLFPFLPVKTKNEPDVSFNKKNDLIVPYQGEDKSIVTKAWGIKLSGSLKEELMWSLYEEALYGSQGSPLYLALIQSGLGDRTAGFGLVDTNRDAFFSCGLRGVSKAEEVTNLIDSTLSNLKTLSKDTISSVLAGYEFKIREQVFNSAAKGIQLLSYIIPPWIFRGLPFRNINLLEEIKSLSLDELYDFFQNRLNVEEGVKIILSPEPKLFESAEISEQEELSNINLDDLEKVKKLQEAVDDLTPDSEELLKLVPTLSLKDLEKEITKYRVFVKEVNNENKLIFSEEKTNGITYLQYGFDGFSVPLKLLPWITLYSRVLTGVGTKKKDLISLSESIQRYTGGIAFSRLTGTNRSTKEPVFRLFLESSCLNENLGEMLDLLKEVSADGRLDDEERIYQIIGELRDSYEQALSTRPHGFAHRRALCRATVPGVIEEILGGFEQLKFLRSLDGLSFEEIHQNLSILRESIFSSSNVITCVTKESCDTTQELSLLDCFSSRNGSREVPEPKKSNDELIISPIRVSYTAQINLVSEYKSGSTDVVLSQVSDTYLWNEIRVGGGAYGSACGYDTDNSLVYFQSWDDPNPKRSFKVYDSVSQYLLTSYFSEDEVVRSIIGTIGSADQPLSPSARGVRGRNLYLLGITDEDRRERRSEVLSTTASDFKRVGELIKDSIVTYRAVVSSKDSDLGFEEIK